MVKTLALTIDGKRIYADEGATILEAAHLNGIAIPTLCHHPGLKGMGHCRVCIVAVEGLGRPLTACDSPVADGLNVTTSTPHLEKMRGRFIELALATHPYKDCLTCLRTGSCELQENAYRYQVNLPEQLERRVPAGLQADNPDLVRDEEKCILCGRCIQVCQAGPGRFVYKMIGRGVSTRIVPWHNGNEATLNEAGCIFCGQCINACPVAALVEQSRKRGGREWDLTPVTGICLGCSLGCLLERYVDHNSLVKNTVPREGDKVGWLCSRGKFDDLKETDDLDHTIWGKAGNSVYKKTDYETGLKATAAALNSIIGSNAGGSALAVVADGRLSNEEVYLLQKLARTILKTAHIDLGLEPLWADARYRLNQITGPEVKGPTANDLSEAGSVLLIGTGLGESHPVVAMALEKAGRFNDTVLIGIERGSETFKAWNVINLKTTNSGTAGLLQTLKAVIEGRVAAGSQMIEQAAGLLSQPGSCTVVAPTFFEKANQAALDALLELVQSAGQLSAGWNRVLLLSRFSNAAGNLAFGGAPGDGAGPVKLNGEAGMNREQILVALRQGQIKGLLQYGAIEAPELPKTCFAAAVGLPDNATGSGFNYIFPGLPAAAKEGTYINAAGQGRFNQRAVVPAAGFVEVWRLICDLATSLGARWRYADLDAVREEMNSI